MHNLKRRAMGSLMAVMMGTTTILGSTPVSAADSHTYSNLVRGAEVVTEAEQATQVNAGNNYGLVSATEGNILHAWDWKFTDVTKNIKEIAESGYSLVQVSPCQVCENASTNNDWWKLYQPYDYKFGNSLGSADDFKEMCEKAKDYGISIVVDVVANHMAGTGQGACGDRKGEVDSWWTNDKFHNTNVKFTGAFDDNREMMVRSNIGMPDIDTGRDDVQKRMVEYLESMLDMGANGFRYDAAKHIGTTSDSGNSQDTFWKTISAAVSAKKPDALVYGEILNSMPVSDEYYVKDGIKVTESQKGWDMKDLVQGGASKVTQKTAFDYTRKSSANKLITWVENHDTYLNHWGSTGLQGHANYMSDEQIMLAWSTVGARADAQALYFARPDGCSNPANPDDPDASNKIDGTLGISTKNFDWKDKKVAAVNKFKNAMVGEGEKTSVQNGLAIIQRGNKGLVVTNFDGGSKNFDVSGLSGLKDGTYEDASGQNGSFTVSGGKVSGSVKGNTFVVLYDENATVPATETPATETPATETPATETPATETPAPATETPFPYETPCTSGRPATATPAPATETPAPATETPAPVQVGSITASVESGTSFTTESLEVKINVGEGVEARYSLDSGRPKAFVGETTVVVGQGKIADSTVNLTVTAETEKGEETKVFTYEKKFDKELAAKEQASGMVVKGNAVMKIKSLFEIVADAAEVNGAAESDAYYATNPNGCVGKEATITGMADFTQDMKVAQCGAWDAPNAFHGAHENSVADCYGLYAAWDNDNLYIGLEMVNTTDTWARGGDGPLSDGGKLSDVPVVIAIDTGKKNKMTGKCPTDEKSGYIWQCHLEFETRIDHLLFASAKGTGNPGLFTADEAGDADYAEHLVGFKDAGITYKSEDGSISPQIMHIDGPDTPADAYDISKYVDAMEQGHDRKYDTFFTYTIPLSALGIDKAHIESNGIGIMGLGTRQTSALDCIPHDPSMLDNAMEDYTIAQDNTSHEKEDLDIITVPLAAVGNPKGNGNQGGDVTKTPTPATKVPASETPASETPASEVPASDTPASKTPASETPASTVPASETPASNTPASNTPASETPASEVPATTTMVVNFGADRSSPQEKETLLVLEAKEYNQKGAATYEFAIDGTVVQAASAENKYAWLPEAGLHTIQVTVKDEEGKSVVVKKQYAIESEGVLVLPTEVPATDAPVPATDAPVPATDAPVPATDAPVPATDAPVPATDVPAPATDAPVPATDAPVPATDAPVPATDVPAPATNVPASQVPATVTPIPTATVIPVGTTTSPAIVGQPQETAKMQVVLKLGKPSPQKLGTSIGLTANVSGGAVGSYKYNFVAELSDGFTQIIAKDSDKNTATWKPVKTGTYKVTVTVTDAAGSKVTDSIQYKITANTQTVKKKLAISKVTLSKKKVTNKKKIKISVNGTASKGTLKFKFVVKKNGQKKVTTIKKYNTKKTAYWTPKKVGKYTITIYATDGSRKVVKKTLKVTVKKK